MSYMIRPCPFIPNSLRWGTAPSSTYVPFPSRLWICQCSAAASHMAHGGVTTQGSAKTTPLCGSCQDALLHDSTIEHPPQAQTKHLSAQTSIWCRKRRCLSARIETNYIIVLQSDDPHSHEHCVELFAMRACNSHQKWTHQWPDISIWTNTDRNGRLQICLSWSPTAHAAYLILRLPRSLHHHATQKSLLASWRLPEIVTVCHRIVFKVWCYSLSTSEYLWSISELSTSHTER